MSILIKGMEMPKNCWDCEVGGAKQMDNATCPFYSMEYWEQENYQDKIADGCPLVPVPQHGRLIDKDVMCNECRRIAEEYDGIYPDCTYCPAHLAPTIIEAEEGEA